MWIHVDVETQLIMGMILPRLASLLGDKRLNVHTFLSRRKGKIQMPLKQDKLYVETVHSVCHLRRVSVVYFVFAGTKDIKNPTVQKWNGTHSVFQLYTVSWFQYPAGLWNKIKIANNLLTHALVF